LRARPFAGKLNAMAELVNLRLARKRKARALAAREAAERRLRFGRAKREVLRQEREAELERRNLEAKRLVREEE
jgi:uncharacterized protein DUF4169